jgi:PEP-CTERM motif
MQPNQFYYPLSLTNSISVTSPDGNTYLWNSADGFGVQSSSPIFRLTMQLYLLQNGPQGNYYTEIDASYNTIQELALPPIGTSGTATLLFSESGSWNITHVPEPSALGLLALGATVFWIKRRRS